LEKVYEANGRDLQTTAQTMARMFYLSYKLNSRVGTFRIASDRVNHLRDMNEVLQTTLSIPNIDVLYAAKKPMYSLDAYKYRGPLEMEDLMFWVEGGNTIVLGNTYLRNMPGIQVFLLDPGRRSATRTDYPKYRTEQAVVDWLATDQGQLSMTQEVKRTGDVSRVLPEVIPTILDRFRRDYVGFEQHAEEVQPLFLQVVRELGRLEGLTIGNLDQAIDRAFGAVEGGRGGIPIAAPVRQATRRAIWEWIIGPLGFRRPSAEDAAAGRPAGPVAPPGVALVQQIEEVATAPVPRAPVPAQPTARPGAVFLARETLQEILAERPNLGQVVRLLLLPRLERASGYAQPGTPQWTLDKLLQRNRPLMGIDNAL